MMPKIRLAWGWAAFFLLAALPSLEAFAAALPMSSIGNESHWIDLRVRDGEVRRVVSNRPDPNSYYAWRSLNTSVATIRANPYSGSDPANAYTAMVVPINTGMVTIEATDGVTGQVLKRDYRVYDSNQESPNNAKVSISVSKTTIDLGDSITLSATSTESFEKYRWVLSDLNTADSADIDLVTQYGPASITLTGKGIGNCNVWLDAINFSGLRAGAASKSISVRDLTPATVTLTAQSMEMAVGETQKLSAGTSDGSDSGYTWSSSAPSVAGVDSTGLVTALAVGTATVTATGKTSGAKASITLTIQAASIGMTTHADCLFGWAETNYSALFSPAGAASMALTPYYYRYYPASGAYLAVSLTDQNVYYLGPLSGNTILNLGALGGWLATSACQ